ncbi:alpha/beta fold hydrolase [Allobacillus sp. GCM10007491]|uniref:Alpha/beta hydrolase n=1 Tax=Allobacillus saliphilus TaxID=2912308 RepID=A0A941CT18_9BACI|nr:alpha/beta hydrolase [Allobacillus saliphilus]MBR7552606.1 alpha/beta hydrolase [Allobacillus saliphilus]
MMTTLQSVEIPNGEQIAYRERKGNGKTILLIHGNMVSSKHWDVLFEALDEDYHLIAPDLQGFGESSYNKPIREINDFAKTIEQFVDQLELTPYAMIGWSMGGTVAMQYCANRPQACEKLILLASGSTRGYPFYATNPDGTPNVEQRLKTYEEIKNDPAKTKTMEQAQRNQDKETMKLVWDTAIYTQKQPDPAKYDEYLADIFTQRNIAECYHALNTFNISPVHNGLVEGTNEVEKIDVPVLVLQGNLDYVVLPQMAEEIMEDLTGDVTYQELTGCGHSPMIDDLETLVKTVEDYLQK